MIKAMKNNPARALMKRRGHGLFALLMGLLLTAAWMPRHAVAQGGAAEYTGEAGKTSETTSTNLAAAVAESSAYRDAVLKEAARHKGTPYLFPQGEYLVIGNDRVAAVFRAANNELAGLVDIYNGGRMLAYGNGPLWKMTLADSSYKPKDFREPTEGLVEVASRQAGATRNQTSRGRRGVTLTFTWEEITVVDEKNVLSVQATISAEAGSPYLRWNLTANNRSVTRGLWQVDFPRLESIVPPGEPSRVGLFLPWGQGRVVNKPFDADAKFEGQYPAPTAPMQYSAIYGPEGGLFLATHDGKMFIKQFIYECRKNPGTAAYFQRHLPENRGKAGVAFQMPYDFVLTSFKGDWFDAARLYREWAIKQVWCSGGPLATRLDVPEWYKKLTFWTLAWEQKSYSNYNELTPRFQKYGLPVDADLTVDDIHKVTSTMDVPYAAHWHGWHRFRSDDGNGGVSDYFPPLIGDEGFRKQVRQIHDVGVMVIPYICALWEKELDSYKERDVFRHCIKDKVGLDYAWVYPHKPKGVSDKKTSSYLDWLCPYTDFWQAEVAEISRKLVADYGVDGIYYDTLSGNAFQCFDPDHGHTVGGGNYWAMGNREALRRSRSAIRKVSPEAIMLSEQPSEAYLDVLDGILLYNVQAMPGVVPAFQAVYHDYFLLFGNYIGLQAAIDHLPMFAGESLVHGDQLGPFNVWPMFLPSHPRTELGKYWEDEAKRKKNIDFLVHIARLKHNSGYKFLTLGEMRNPLIFSNELPILEVKQQDWPKGPRRMPAVINAVWKAPDGTLGLVFCNVSESEQTVNYKIDLAEYGLPARGSYKVTELYENGATQMIGRYQESSFARVETIQARRGLLLEIRPE